jgi:hypothetical protein
VARFMYCTEEDVSSLLLVMAMDNFEYFSGKIYQKKNRIQKINLDS